MFQVCRPTGRLIYLVLAGTMALSIRVGAREESSAVQPRRSASSPAAKPAAGKPLLRPEPASPAPQSGPTLTNVIDTVFRADGTQAQGELLISWPAFVQ